MNQDPDPFTERLRAQPPAGLPPAWRAEILAAAAPPRQTIWWPARPWAWAMAAAWMVIAALHLATPGLPDVPNGSVARQTDLTSPATLVDNEFTLRNQLLARQDSEGSLP